MPPHNFRIPDVRALSSAYKHRIVATRDQGDFRLPDSRPSHGKDRLRQGTGLSKEKILKNDYYREFCQFRSTQNLMKITNGNRAWGCHARVHKPSARTDLRHRLRLAIDSASSICLPCRQWSLWLHG